MKKFDKKFVWSIGEISDCNFVTFPIDVLHCLVCHIEFRLDVRLKVGRATDVSENLSVFGGNCVTLHDKVALGTSNDGSTGISML